MSFLNHSACSNLPLLTCHLQVVIIDLFCPIEVINVVFPGCYSIIPSESWMSLDEVSIYHDVSS